MLRFLVCLELPRVGRLSEGSLFSILDELLANESESVGEDDFRGRPRLRGDVRITYMIRVKLSHLLVVIHLTHNWFFDFRFFLRF